MKFSTEPFMPIPLYYSSKAGITYARHLAKSAQYISYWLTVNGWFFVIFGTVLGVLATILGSNSNMPECFPSPVKEHPGVIAGACGLIMGGIGWQLMDRASAAGKVAVVATLAIQIASTPPSEDQQNPDKLAYDKCIEAKAAWLEGRQGHERLKATVSNFKGI